MGSVFASLDRDDNVLVIGLNRAVDLLAAKLASIRSLGPHPKDQAPVVVKKGRFGPYVQHGDMIANLPRDVGMDDITLDEAAALVAEKGKKMKPRGGKKPTKAAAAKPAKAEKPAKVAKPVVKKKAVAKPKAAVKKKVVK